MPTLAKRLEVHLPAYRILKLTWRTLFDSSIYIDWIRIAQGAFAQVTFHLASWIEIIATHAIEC
jgi:hypothetical protein